MIKIRRVYDEPLESEGKRYLVDCIWPRGVKKEALGLTAWRKELAPSSALRKWFAHDPDKWEEFRALYRRELAGSEENRQTLEDLARQSTLETITLLFAAGDRERNNAVVLKEVIEEKVQEIVKTLLEKAGKNL